MNVLFFDLETTGLDPKKDKIIEVGAMIWNCEKKQPMKIFSEFFWDLDYPEINNDAALVNGLSTELIKSMKSERTLLEFFDLMESYTERADVQYFVAHNGNNFDKLFFDEAVKDHYFIHLKSRPWIDTKTDLPHKHQVDSYRLKHLAADYGIINPFPHRAIFDVAVMAQVFSQFTIEEILAEKNEPKMIMAAKIPAPWEDKGVGKDLARKNGFRWQECDGKIFEKAWVKKIKHCDHEKEIERMKPYILLQVG